MRKLQLHLPPHAGCSHLFRTGADKFILLSLVSVSLWRAGLIICPLHDTLVDLARSRQIATWETEIIMRNRQRELTFCNRNSFIISEV